MRSCRPLHSGELDYSLLSEYNPIASRRDFLRRVACGACAYGLLRGLDWIPGFASEAAAQDAAPPLEATQSPAPDEASRFIAPARHWEKGDNDEVTCRLCPRLCELEKGQRGDCRVRQNINGELKTLVHGRVVSLHVDPIEKKPMFHFLPASSALSLATAGCNFRCRFCQNWQISQNRPEDVEAVYLAPAKVAAMAAEKKIAGIAYTYSEPVVFYEFMLDTAREARKRGVRNVMISNGSIRPEPMRELCEVLDGIKVDFKAYQRKFYSDVCRGELQPVLDTMKLVRSLGKWLEIVVLIIPTLNDSAAECKEMCQWIHGELGPDVPLHFSRFTPNYKMRNLPATPMKTLERNCDIAQECGIRYIYLGNAPGHRRESTWCPGCGEQVIERYGFVARSRLKPGGKCPRCEYPIPGVWA